MVSMHTSPVAQTLPQAPQWVGSLVGSVQIPAQLVRPSWHESTQDPLEQTLPAAQALPQAPQFATSVCVFAQRPVQGVRVA